MPPPSAGGVVLVQLLGMLQRLGAAEKPRGSADELHLFLEASRRAQAERRFSVSDPDAWPAPERSQRLAKLGDVDRLLAEHPIDPERATPSSSVHPLYPVALKELEHTTHFSVVDADGRVVACTMTLSGSFGAKLVAPGTGIVLNNAVASFGTAGENLPRPSRRTTSSMAPTLVLRAGAPVLVLGSPGGDTIPSTVTQILRSVVDHGVPLDEAVDLPRVHHGFAPDEVRTERDHPLPKLVISGLRERGHELKAKSSAMGSANVILIDAAIAYGYADPREGGLALAVPETGP
jgi:gamma-glutamyltranspeptidase/glutathione hydrolase